METIDNNLDALDAAKFNDFKCSKPDHIDTAHENEAMDEEFTSGQILRMVLIEMISIHLLMILTK